MDNIELIKDRLPVTAMVVRYNGVMKNRHVVGPSPCCDHKGCFSVSEDDRTWKCFSCGKGGSVMDLIMAAENCDFKGALRRAAEWAGVELTKPVAEEKQPRESAQERMYRLTAEFYEAAMTPDSFGWKWFCETRGHKEVTLKKLRVGWSTGRLIKFLEDHGYTPADVVKHGLATDKDTEGNSVPPYDYYGAGLAIFPIIDHAGKVISFTAKDPAKKRKASMLRGAAKKWFLNYFALGKHNEIIVVEGENDLASLMDAGFYNVIATAGAPGSEQVTLIKNFCSGKTVYLWFDKDPDKDPRKNEGGAHHTRFLYEGLRGSNINVRIISHPGKAKDTDDYIRGGYAE